MTTSKRRESFASYRKRCQRASERMGLALDLLADDDPYEILGEMKEAHAARTAPTSFLRQAFAEDLDRQAGDAQEFSDSLNSAFGDDGE